MKTILILTTVFFSNLIISQSIVDTTKMWRTEINGFPPCSTTNPMSEQITETIKFEGDTIINQKHYKKVLKAIDEFHIDWNFYLYIREDSNQKVYFRSDTSQQEYLLYDFNVNIGDTLNISSVLSLINGNYSFFTNDEMVVDSIDTIFIAGENRKRISIRCDYCQDEYWIEGIGNLQNGILTNRIGILNSTGYTLLCVYKSDTLQYGSGNDCYHYYECPSNINEQQPNINNSKIYPNPVVNVSTLTIFDQSLKNNLFELYDCRGAKIISKSIEHEYKIDRRDYNKGIYFYSITNNGEIISTGKILIE